jgi:RimJ/RimL family protein N-acetyltransferase
MRELLGEAGLPPETTRLIFRRLDPHDREFVAAMLADPVVRRFCPRAWAGLDAGAWIQAQIERYERDGHGLWLVVEKAAEQPVGQVGLVRHCLDRVSEAEVAFLIHGAFRRRGLAAEAALAVRDHAFRQGWPRVISLVHPDNRPSQGVALRLGMSLAGWTFFGGTEHLVYSVPRGTP